ncbi:MAG TPA: hypothetical protein VL095_12100 [Flavisolibacter sp.]|nr:hypothetical protein [Flavisolibacter sp.]
MENLILFLATSLVFRFSSSKKIKLQFIGNTGCSALLSSDNDLESTLTQSGDQLYFHEFKDRNVTYGMICIDMNEPYGLAEAEEMLRSYIDKLRGPLYILHNTGIHEDADWNSETSKTIVDYWQDHSKKDWKVKGYTNGKTLAVLYVKNIGNADVRKQDFFLDSFHFGAAS